ncbi:hypothetical protein Syn7803C97_40 [Synechococcus phage S-MbCM6]|jgi:hypothetical protein|uniref:Uncharacterized protein n=3 Tax=Namakavirus smbcm6 TaxID=2734120 RepID=H8ZME5_9CAUD|nr:hypothetical protein [Synechococcus phage ACG-2014c]AHB80674.1 hypothetical protein S-MbCM25_039 [Synechococcus phage S-MbCM25]AFD02656.1 hypothetical protein [Synechococcus phage ACG-2014c]AIX14433.1 hypothetical protein Syn7803C43_38 [Synechococcus phage ACG-2014c]AIX22593.1 hypothetical protein Syn7803C97_40 [Synechococcus phage ACG-2014c]AIX22807.1 hypothetical protein Syn7803C98_39 [Synechococcus phage ACG-2014c]
MGKTFRRGGNERGYYSPGKSLRDKRQRGGSNRVTSWDYDDNYQTKKNKTKKESFDNFEGDSNDI